MKTEYEYELEYESASREFHTAMEIATDVPYDQTTPEWILFEETFQKALATATNLDNYRRLEWMEWISGCLDFGHWFSID